MSSIPIFLLEVGAVKTLEFGNAWRGAMYVWNYVATEYCGLPVFPPGFSEEGKADQMKVWNYGNNNPDMPEHEAIVLLSTMDHALLDPSQWERLVEAYEKFGEEHPNSSFGEQAKALRDVMESGEDMELLGIGWNQNTICPSKWVSYDDDGVMRVYDPARENSHFWMMEQLDEARRSAAEVEAAGGGA
ncbi:hypothetical protein [Modicisalibacter sp. MOD 31.J]|uniref:hypothetical protein n=1 Tax=Modicisalibacter sp. MOD 31.J TaxID=2831897 RepID=UPI001CCC0D99|nr:hypothetical protein [Modicisalibacter sp. MOD 31.J]MBZ9574592.1 hypothetical protein [Modicisalibacter sp. MOD 31.J]